MRAREVPGKQTTVATAASVGEQIQKTARHGSPPIMWEGGEDESTLKDIQKQFVAQRVPAQTVAASNQSRDVRRQGLSAPRNLSRGR